jgi:hypothetical protein
MDLMCNSCDIPTIVKVYRVPRKYAVIFLLCQYFYCFSARSNENVSAAAAVVSVITNAAIIAMSIKSHLFPPAACNSENS